MHLDSLTLINVRQFERRTFEFLPGFNLLVGENGAGKTTILRGLLAALGSARQLGRRPTLDDDDIRLRARHAEVCAVVHYEDRAEEFRLQKSLWKPARRSVRRRNPLTLLYSSNEATCSAMKTKRVRRIRELDDDRTRSSEEFLYTFEMELARRSAVSNERLFGSSRSVRGFVGEVLSTFSPEMDAFYWRFEPYDCSLVPSESSSSRSLDVETKRQARAFAMRKFQEGQSPTQKRPFVWPDKAKVVLTPGGQERKRTSSELPDLRKIWKDMEISETSRRVLLASSLEVKLAPRIMIQRRIGALSLNQLSDGEQRLFSLFVDIARQLSLNAPPDALAEGEAIILIDEIDVHLHPKWQRRIVPALEDLFPNCQFIATTHSPFVIQATSRHRIASVDPGFSAQFVDGGNSIDDIAEDIQGVSIPQRSLRAERLSSAAKRYFLLLELQSDDPRRVKPAELRAAEKSYREASEPFTSDPAIHALLTVLSSEGSDQ